MIEYKHHVHKGRIAVYSNMHRLVESRLYYTSEGMKKIMGAWMKEYPFKDYYIQVRPYAEEKKAVYRLEIPEKIKRPAAVYSNIPVYPYDERKNGHD